MNVFEAVKRGANWLFGSGRDHDDDNDEGGMYSNSGRSSKSVGPGNTVRIRLQPVLSDPYPLCNAGIQGFRWYVESMLMDKWGNLGQELLSESSAGRLKQLPVAQRRRLDTNRLELSNLGGVLSVSLPAR